MIAYRNIQRKLTSSQGGAILVLMLVLLVSECESSPQKGQERMRLLMGSTSAIYNYPFLCVIHWRRPGPGTQVLGSGSIFTEKTILFTVDSIDRYIPGRGGLFYQNPKRLVVYAGTDVMSPVEPLSNDAVAAQVTKIIVARQKSDWDLTAFIEINPDNMETMDYRRNPLGDLEMEVGIMEISPPFRWTPFILPIPLVDEKTSMLNTKLNNIVKTMNDYPGSTQDCTVAGWGPIGHNEIMYHKVVYVTSLECQEVLCGEHPETCLLYPDPNIHVCFKALSYGDVCLYDQGSPLYCPWLGASVLAILTKTFDCGLDSLPAIYTLTSKAATFYSKIYRTDTLPPRPDYTKYEYNNL